MPRCLALFFIVACVNEVLCVQGSCGAQAEPAAPQGAAGCGCGSLNRAAAAAAEPVEEQGRTPAAEKYSEEVNERLAEGQRDERNIQSQVGCRCCPFLTHFTGVEDMQQRSPLTL